MVHLRNLLLVVQTLILLSAYTTKTQGQHAGLNKPEMRRDIERRESDQQLLMKPPAKKADDSARLAVLKQIKEDFRNIQSLNNTMMANTWAHEELDYGNISDSISQIKSKAIRLRSNLALPKAKDVKDREEKQPDLVNAGVKEFRAALLTLDKSIMSFVTNPIFQESNVVDVSLTDKASHDLDMIIEFSTNLHKSAAASVKKAKNTH